MLLIATMMLMQPASVPVSPIAPPPPVTTPDLYAGPTYRAWTARDQRSLDGFRADAIQILRDGMRDYESARFRDVTVKVLDGMPIWCGYVNGKNVYGTYTGPQRFALSILGGFQTERLTVRETCRADGAGINLHDQSASLTYKAAR
jgi:hypothetical protein